MQSYIASHLKDMNRSTVYHLLKSEKKMSRAEISRRTGISTPTVLKIVNFMLENHLLEELGEGPSKIGRKPQMLLFNPKAAYAIGIEYDGSMLKMGIVDLSGEILAYKEIKVEDDFQTVLKTSFLTEVKSFMAEADEKATCLGVGIGIPGVVDVVNQSVLAAPIIGISEPLECREIILSIEEALGVRVYMENDINAAALGEFASRKMGEENDLIFLLLREKGFGAGILLNGKIRHGSRYFAGEIGYMVYDPSFQISPIEGGWLEQQLFSQAREALNEEEKIDNIAQNIALGIANSYALLDVNEIVIGGVLALQGGNLLLTRINEYLSRFCLLPLHCKLQISKEPCITGAASIVIENSLDIILE